MRRECLAGILCCLSGGLSASGGTPLNWLDGTQPWDSTPAGEVDLQTLGSGGGGAQTQAGLAAQWGVLDTLQASGQWATAADGAPTGGLDLRWREPYYPDNRPAFSLYARAPFSGGNWRRWAGLVATVEPFDSDLALNAEASDTGRWRVRLGAWTPYLLPTLRLGAEASWLDGVAEAFTPQVLINAPGDLSLQAGVRFDAYNGSALWTARLSYELFASP